MKTILRISTDATLKLSSFATKLIANAFAKVRSDYPEAVLVVEDAEDAKPVYITIGSHPPELVLGHREVFAVYAPIDAQDPIATFADETEAREWAEGHYDKTDYEITGIMAPESPQVRVSVATMIERNGKMLLCRTGRGKLWTLPEVPLSVGESSASAARRCAELVGVQIDVPAIPIKVPYINLSHGRADQHILVICMAATFLKGRAKCPTDSIYDRVKWMPADKVPYPMHPLIEGVLRVVDPGCLSRRVG